MKFTVRLEPTPDVTGEMFDIEADTIASAYTKARERAKGRRVLVIATNNNHKSSELPAVSNGMGYLG